MHNSNNPVMNIDERPKSRKEIEEMIERMFNIDEPTTDELEAISETMDETEFVAHDAIDWD